MEKLKLDSLNGLLCEKPVGFQNIFGRFTGKAENRMDNGLNPRCPEVFEGFDKPVQPITAADKAGRFFVNGLQTEFNPDGLDLSKSAMTSGERQSGRVAMESMAVSGAAIASE